MASHMPRTHLQKIEFWGTFDKNLYEIFCSVPDPNTQGSGLRANETGEKN
jgi:hypothetical protein